MNFGVQDRAFADFRSYFMDTDGALDGADCQSTSVQTRFLFLNGQRILIDLNQRLSHGGAAKTLGGMGKAAKASGRNGGADGFGVLINDFNDNLFLLLLFKV